MDDFFLTSWHTAVMISTALPDLDALDVEALKALVIAKHSELLEQHKSTAQEIEHLKLVIEKYRRMIFGRKSEKLTAQLEQLEFRLEELETAQAADEARQAATEAAAPSSTQPAAKRRSRPARKPLPEDLPREVVTHFPPHNNCPDCGGALRQFGEDVSEQLERIPASFKVIRHVRPKFACAGCESVVEAPAPARPIDRGLPGPGLLAHVLVSKYGDHLPLYRQSQIYAREGIDLDRSTLADWVGGASALLEPLVGAIGRYALGAYKLHGDDTPVPVLCPGRGTTKQGRLWTYVRDDRPAGSADPPAAFFRYSPDRKGERPRAHLANFAGVLQADAYAGFDRLYGEKIKEAACWAHVRRKFYDIHVALCSPIALEALQRIGRLDKMEEENRARQGPERHQGRQARAGR